VSAPRILFRLSNRMQNPLFPSAGRFYRGRLCTAGLQTEFCLPLPCGCLSAAVPMAAPTRRSLLVCYLASTPADPLPPPPPSAVRRRLQAGLLICKPPTWTSFFFFRACTSENVSSTPFPSRPSDDRRVFFHVVKTCPRSSRSPRHRPATRAGAYSSRLRTRFP